MLFRSKISVFAPAHDQMFHLLGVMLLLRSRTVEGTAFVRRGLAIRPDHAEAHYNLAITDTLAGRIAASVANYRRSLVLRPQYGEGHHNLANALAQLGSPEAIVR